MQLKQLLKLKGIKHKFIADAISTDKSTLSRKLQHNRLSLNELKVLRIKNILSLEDLDILTK